MLSFRDFPIKRKMSVAMLGTTIAVLLAACATLLAYEYATSRQVLARNLNTLADVLALNSTAALSFSNTDDAKETLQAVSAKPSIEAACIYDGEGAVFATYLRVAETVLIPTRPENDGIRFASGHVAVVRPVVLAGKRLGTLYLRADLTEITAHLRTYAQISGLVILGSLAFALVLSTALQRAITRPILALTDTAKTIAQTRDYTARANKLGDDEIGALTDDFNQMLRAIQERDNAVQDSNKALFTENVARRHAEDEIRLLNASLERRVDERTSELQAANKELEGFSYSVSHDLRSPLRAVDGYSRMVAEKCAEHLDDDGRRMLGVIRSETARMGRLIDDLLTFSRLGRQKLDSAIIDMRTMAQSVFDELAAAEPERKVRFTLHPIPAARGTAAMIRQVWVNLLSNAVKFTKEREAGEIEVGAREDSAGGTIYYVKDNGAGFDMRYADKLFGVFQRLHSAGEFPGTGVGLALVQRIVQRHGGRVWAEAEVNRGATFSFTLSQPRT